MLSGGHMGILVLKWRSSGIFPWQTDPQNPFLAAAAKAAA